jgi:hypothetical protein
VRGRLWFHSGALLHVDCSALTGADALYQLLERPIPASFTFTERPLPESVAALTPLDMRGLLEEGMKRHEELQHALAIAPDDAVLKPTIVKPRPDPAETDPQVLRQTWLHACSGVSLGEWDISLGTDSWRVRRIVARWIEEGALELQSQT